MATSSYASYSKDEYYRSLAHAMTGKAPMTVDPLTGLPLMRTQEPSKRCALMSRVCTF
jgi:hypothetical protein